MHADTINTSTFLSFGQLRSMFMGLIIFLHPVHTALGLKRWAANHLPGLAAADDDSEDPEDDRCRALKGVCASRMGNLHASRQIRNCSIRAI